jgi:hypothetical protein
MRLLEFTSKTWTNCSTGQGCSVMGSSVFQQRLFHSSNSPELPRLIFKDGISSLKNTPGCDRAGMFFALPIASLTHDGSRVLLFRQWCYSGYN